MGGRVVKCEREYFDVYTGRPGPRGNRFRIGREGDRAEVIRKGERWIRARPELVARAKHELRGGPRMLLRPAPMPRGCAVENRRGAVNSGVAKVY